MIAVNAGRCVIPLLLALWQTRHVSETEGWPLTALAITVLADVAICYRLARSVPGVGILLPASRPPWVAIGMSWLLLTVPGELPFRPPVAFVAGVLGPLVGAALLHLRHITKMPVGVVSIGGAGTFDGTMLLSFLPTLMV